LAARPTWSVRALTERLTDTQGRLNELTRGDPGVRASFTVSHQQLAAPTSAEARREALRTPNGQTVWKVPVRCYVPDEDWVVLWQPRGGDALIAYIGPL
jgi:hypothetical protein